MKTRQLPRIECSGDWSTFYLRLSEGEVARSVVLDDQHVFDCDADGSIIGVEFLGLGPSCEAGLRMLMGGGLRVTEIPVEHRVVADRSDVRADPTNLATAREIVERLHLRDRDS